MRIGANSTPSIRGTAVAMKAKTNHALRKFALVMAVPLGLLAGLGYWRHKAAWPYLAGAAGFFLVVGLVFPKALAPVEWAWMKLAQGLSFVMTHLIVGLAFFLVITPIGLILRVIGKRPLALAPDPKATTYWEAVEADSIYTRSDKPY